MEPTVTCLDEAEWLGKFEPSEVIAGMTIDFDPDCTEGEPNGRGTTHRVVKVKVENGIYYYWPKGDGNREADGCWIPVGHVTGYMIALYQDTQPQNESLRLSVLYVRSAYYAARDAWERAREQYDSLLAHHCGEQPTDACALAEPAYSLVVTESTRVETLRQTLLRAIDAYECWMDRALYPSSSLVPPPLLVNGCY